MDSDTIYRNKHTNDLFRVIDVDAVKNYPNTIIVYVLEQLDNGEMSRWEFHQFFEHFVVNVEGGDG